MYGITIKFYIVMCGRINGGPSVEADESVGGCKAMKGEGGGV